MALRKTSEVFRSFRYLIDTSLSMGYLPQTHFFSRKAHSRTVNGLSPQAR